jgi:cytochrome P450
MSAGASADAVVDLADLDLPSVSTVSDEYLADPDAVWRRVRQDSWLAQTELGVNVLPHAANFQMVRTRQLTTMGDSIMQLQGITEGLLYDYWTQGLIMTQDDVPHARLRKLMARAFTPRAVDQLRPTMRTVAQQLIDDFPAGRVDLVKQFTHQYPVEIMARLMGIPTADIGQFGRWSTDLGLLFSFPVTPHQETVEAALKGLLGYAADLIADRRASGTRGDDLISLMIAAEEDGDRLSSAELQWQVVNLTFAGHDTTRNQLAFILAMFCDHPDEWRTLAADPSLAPNAIEEGLRLNPVIPATMRTVADDFVHDGVRFPAGTFVILRADCANRDPEVFPDPDRLDLHRANAHQQLTFGGGVHHCLGAALARAEMQEALPLLAQALPDLAADGPGEWRPASAMLLGTDSLPVRFTDPVALGEVAQGARR